MERILTLSASCLRKAVDPARWRRVWLAWMRTRQRLMDGVLSSLYAAPMRVLPRGYVGVAAAAVFWFWQDGVRQVILLRTPQKKDSRARLVSCFGLGAHPDLSHAMRASVETQLGKTFSKTLDKKDFAPDRVAAAPMFTFHDDSNGISSPVQVLAWTVPINPVQLDLIELAPGMELAVTTEAVLNQPGSGISPTHRNIWLAVARHLPKLKGIRRADGVEEVTLESAVAGKAGVRTLH